MTVAKGYLVADDADWRIPAYAQDMLWIQVGSQAVQTSGPRGAFELNPSGETGESLRLTWGTVGGPMLASVDRPDSGAPFVACWKGMVAVGGFVERLHALERRGLELVVAEIEGALLPPDYARLPTLDQMRCSPFHRPNEPGTARDFVYTFLALADSIYAEYLHHAVVSELAVDCVAVLGPEEGRWHELVGLPLLVEAVTLLAPGYR